MIFKFASRMECNDLECQRVHRMWIICVFFLQYNKTLTVSYMWCLHRFVHTQQRRRAFSNEHRPHTARTKKAHTDVTHTNRLTATPPPRCRLMANRAQIRLQHRRIVVHCNCTNTSIQHHTTRNRRDLHKYIYCNMPYAYCDFVCNDFKCPPTAACVLRKIRIESIVLCVQTSRTKRMPCASRLALVQWIRVALAQHSTTHAGLFFMARARTRFFSIDYFSQSKTPPDRQAMCSLQWKCVCAPNSRGRGNTSDRRDPT